MMKNNFLVIISLLLLSACTSNFDKNANNQPAMPSSEAQSIRETADPQPAINEHINGLNRNVGAVNSVPK